MIVQNLSFYDKFGKNLNLNYNSETSLWEGKLFFEPLSVFLFDNENLFILEKVGAQYTFPTISAGQSLKFSWKDNQNENELFIYDVEKNYDLNNLFINKVTEKIISYSDIYSVNSPVNVNLPLQLNIAFNPSEEKIFKRTLLIYLVDENNVNSPIKIAEIYFYGEGEDEDERFRVWTQNFGIKFNKEDANILKDYDVKEAFPDWEQLNQARKTLLVNKEQIFPYVGTYKGLSNFVNILGYKDVLQIKEYWKNVNPRSSYFAKYQLVDISDYLDDGVIDTFDISARNNSMRTGAQFNKTEFLALVYQFTVATDNFDDDGVPEVVETTEFTVNEMFYKLNLLKGKLKEDFLPVNVKIKEIIGEFIYFQKITLSYWRDAVDIRSYELNDRATIQFYPTNINLVLRSLEPLYRQKDPSGIDFGEVRFNNTTSNPFELNQNYTRDKIPSMITYIEEFYNNIRDQRYPNLHQRLSWESGDDPERVIGAPVIIRLDFEKFTFETFKGVTFEDLASTVPNSDPYFTLENLDFKNTYEVTWRITKDSPNQYNFEYRGKVIDLYELPHFLPYAGKYRVTAELHDFYGNTSTYSDFIEVSDQKTPEIVAFTRLEDKFDYTIQNLSNIQLKDFGSSPFYYPRVNLLYNEDIPTRVDIYKNLLEWISFFKNRYGMGQNLYDAEFYDAESNTYVPYTSPYQKHEKKLYWGLGENKIPLQLKDLQNIELGSLYFMRISDLIYLDDFEAGFYMNKPEPGQILKISLYSNYIIPEFNTLQELVDILNASNHHGVRLFNYEIISGKIHAQAEYLSPQMYHILYSDCAGSPGSLRTSSPSGPVPTPTPTFKTSSPASPGGHCEVDKYTFFLPRNVYSTRVIEYLHSLSPVFDEETLFLFAKTSDLLSGAVQDPFFWQDTKYWKFENDNQKGYLPTIMDQNAFNINDIKVFDESFNIPENSIIFFAINNIDGKNEFIWTLLDKDDNEVIRVKSVPFFAWKFKDLGKFKLKVEVIDNRNTTYYQEIKNFITVLDKRAYIEDVEFKLTQRKNKQLKSI